METHDGDIYNYVKRAALISLCTIASNAACLGQDINNTTNLFLSSGLQVATSGMIVNDGFIQNQGAIALKGNWLNRSVYQGTGSITLNGSDQLLSNNNQAIDHLVADGGGIKTLAGNLLITSKIDFIKGIFLVADSDSLVFDSNCRVKNASQLSYVDGAVSTRGTGYKFYPVGTGGEYHPLELIEIEGIDPIIEVEVFQNMPTIKTSAPASIYSSIYWSRKIISGTFQQSPVTLSYDVSSVNSVRLVLAYGESLVSEFTLLNNLTVQSSNGTNVVGSRKPINGNLFVLGEVPVDPPRQQYFSTSLSPNAANPMNRVVKVFGDNPNPSVFSFQVFNRWGILVFESTSYSSMSNDGWDGKQNGSSLASGAYPYHLKMIDISGNAVIHNGFITIIN
ncbi:hypothetical protein BH10BAC4_BH10BAC4_09140 [soil metagenome]